MEDLIKRSDVWNITAILHSEFITIEQEQILERIDEMVDGLPSADRPQGEWIDMGDFEQCSVCKGTRLKEFQSYYGKVTWIKTPYCPNCGARMFAKDTNVPNKKGADDDN